MTIEVTDMTLGMINTLMKNETANIFYGVAYSSKTVKDDTEETYLPVWLGVEAEATSWMVMRGSVKQNILINSDKDKASGDIEDLHSTAVAAGLGIKLGKGMLDATFTQVTGGTINSDNLLSNVSYTYMF